MQCCTGSKLGKRRHGVQARGDDDLQAIKSAGFNGGERTCPDIPAGNQVNIKSEHVLLRLLGSTACQKDSQGLHLSKTTKGVLSDHFEAWKVC